MESLRRDSKLNELIEEHGEIEIKPADDPFKRTVTSIINQQLSTDSAAAIRERVFGQFEVSPAGMKTADEQELMDAGLSGQKVDYVQHIAEAFEQGRIHPENFEGVSDADVIAELTEIRGVGVWTAKMYLIFCLGRPDVFPVEDLGIRRSMTTLYGIEDREEMVEYAGKWRPYRSYASRYLWRVSD